MTNLDDPSRYTQNVEQLAVGPHLPGIIQIVPHYNTNAIHTTLNVLYWEGSSTGYTIPMLTAAQSAFDGAWQAGWTPLAGGTDQYLGSIVTDMSSPSGLQVLNTTYPPALGTATGAPIADNCSYLLSLKEGLHYKGGHGRVYIPGVVNGTTNADGNTITTAAINHLQTLWSSTVTAMAAVTTVNGGPYNPVVWHKKLRSAPNTVQIVVSALASPRLATQRRRLRKAAHR